MTDYAKVDEALKSGADPDMLCMTCPWDRFCIRPPTMTSDEIRQRMDDAERKDRERKQAGEQQGMPVGMLLTALTMGGRDRMAEVCPVFALKLRTADGRQIVDTIKSRMQQGGESA